MSREENRNVDDERVSLWSVPRRFRRMYFPLFYLLGIIGIGWSVWYEASRLGSAASYHDIANAVIMKTPAILLTAAFTSLVITEATMVLAEMVGDYLRKRNARIEAAARAKGLAEGRTEGRTEGLAEGLAEGRTKGRTEGLAEGRTKGRTEGLEEGRTEGLAEGRVQMGREWSAWNRRRLEAEERGEVFDEPPPSSGARNGASKDK